mgnify:FL=1
MAVLKRAKKNDTKVSSMFTEDNVKSLGRQYVDISSQIKALEEQKKALAEKIKQGAEQFGVKDDKGSFYLESEDLMMGKVAKKSFKIDQDKAVKTLESMGIGDVVDEVTVRTVNEDRLQQAVSDGRLSLDTVESFTNVSVSYSVLVKEKEAMPEVEQTTLKSAAKRK